MIPVFLSKIFTNELLNACYMSIRLVVAIVNESGGLTKEIHNKKGIENNIS